MSRKTDYRSILQHSHMINDKARKRRKAGSKKSQWSIHLVFFFLLRVKVIPHLFREKINNFEIDKRYSHSMTIFRAS